jgi:hypothetical protein
MVISYLLDTLGGFEMIFIMRICGWCNRGDVWRGLILWVGQAELSGIWEGRITLGMG